MARSGHDTGYCENAFSLTLPEERAFQLRLTRKRAWLITNINEIGCNHRDGKRNGNRVGLGNFAARWLDHYAACIRFCVGLSFFVLSKCRGRKTNNQGAHNEQCETAAGVESGVKPPHSKARCAPARKSPIHRFAISLVHCFCGVSCWILWRSASASAVFPMRRWHCSRSVNAPSDSLISIERVCDATACAKSARCRSRTPRKNHNLES